MIERPSDLQISRVLKTVIPTDCHVVGVELSGVESRVTISSSEYPSDVFSHTEL